MAAFKHFSRLLLLSTNNSESSSCLTCRRFLQYSPKVYDEKQNPAPVFIKKEVQSLLKTLTRMDLSKVYRKRKLETQGLSQPEVKFLTTEQLEEIMAEVKNKVDNILQMPPVLPIRKPIDKILSLDPALQGLETTKIVFTDITFGVSNSKRLIAVRDTDGTLRDADWELRDRMNQTYFPVKHRLMKPPKMFVDDTLFESLLERKEYEYVLDRACLQFEPDDIEYQKIVSLTYQHLNDNSAFDTIRSTRHFGVFSFFVAWNNIADNLLLDLLETQNVNECNALVSLYGQIHGVQFNSEGELRSTEEFVAKFANKKGILELALQALKDRVRRDREIEEGIKEAHGLV